MFRRILCTLLALGGVLALGLPARAQQTEGSIRVTLQNGESVVTDGAVTLYRVGRGAEGGYRLEEDFGGGLIKEQDALSPILARWLWEAAGPGGTALLLDADGSAEFSNLTEGLYLLVQTEASTGYHLMEPMLVQLPCQYQWHVQAYPITPEIIWEIPSTGDTMALPAGLTGLVLSGTGLILCAGRRRRKA